MENRPDPEAGQVGGASPERGGGADEGPGEGGDDEHRAESPGTGGPDIEGGPRETDVEHVLACLGAEGEFPRISARAYGEIEMPSPRGLIVRDELSEMPARNPPVDDIERKNE